MKKAISIWCLLFLVHCGNSQDVHFTNFSLAPQTLNPAFTGSFYGTLKIGGIYRDQFSQFFNSGYKTQNIGIEQNLAKGLKDHHWIGIGGEMTNDVSGDLSFGSTRFALSSSYHWSFDKSYSKIFSLGLQLGYLQRRADGAAAILRSELDNPSSTSQDRQLLDDYEGKRFDLSVGISYRAKLNSKVNMKTGFAVYHLLASSFNLSSNTEDYFPLRYNASMEFNIRQGKKAYWTPRLYYGRTDNASFLTSQLLYNFLVKQQDLQFGLGYRVGDAVQILAGMTWNDWTIRASYDATVSSAAEYNNNVGGFEIGAFKIINIHPKTKIKLIELCPRL